MNIRALDPVTDRDLLATAYGWARNTPRWFQEMDATYGPDDFEAYLKASRNGGVDVGVFDPQLVGVFIFTEPKPGRFECHLMAPRTARFQALAMAGYDLRQSLFARGAHEISAWVASRNRPLIRLCEAMGLTWYGVEMIHGQYYGRVIRWQRMSQNRSQWEQERKAA